MCIYYKYVLDTTGFEESIVKNLKILCKRLHWNFSDDLRGILKTTCPVDGDEDDHNDDFHLLLEENESI